MSGKGVCSTESYVTGGAGTHPSSLASLDARCAPLLDHSRNDAFMRSVARASPGVSLA